MSKRGERKRKQHRKKQARKRITRTVSADGIASRTAWLVENFPRIKAQVVQVQDETGQMPGFVLLEEPNNILIADKLAPLIAAIRDYPGLQREVMERDYGDDDCVLVVRAGDGIMRTSYQNAKLRYDLRDSGARIVGLQGLWPPA